VKKFLLLPVVIVFIIMLLIGCSDQATIEAALEKVNVKVDKTYLVDDFDNITIAFYKEKSSGHQMVGVFNKEKKRFSFISQQDLQLNMNTNEEVTFNAFLHDEIDGIPEYSFQFGVINNPQIENINLHMAGEPYLEDRHAKIIQIDSLTIWYTYLDISRIFNIQQGLSKDGKIIYSNNKAYD
jgi:hypothetical protein